MTGTEVAAAAVNPPPLSYENPAAGIRTIPAVTGDEVTRAVLAARAVVSLDQERWDLAIEVASLRRQLADSGQAVSVARANASQHAARVAAVRDLHRQASRGGSACPEGCCQEVEYIGSCEECGGTYPCSTIRVLDGAV